MDDQKTIESSGAFGIPKWIIKKGMRYEVDDFIVSPPTNEDGGFMRLRYGRCPSPRHPLAEPELGMTVEVRESSSVISGLGRSDGEVSPNPGATITFGRGVLSAETSPSTPDTPPPESLFSSAQSSPQHLLPAPFGDTTTATKNETLSKGENNLSVPGEDLLHPIDNPRLLRSAGSTGSLPSLSSKGSVIINTFRKISGTQAPIQELLSEKGEYEKRLEESVRELSVTGTPEVSPNPTPGSSPVLKRKVSNIVMENPPKNLVAHSYFCTKPFQPQHTPQLVSEAAGTSQEGAVGGTTSLSSTTTTMTQQMDEGAKLAQTLDVAGHVMGKRRQRPKPSALREMNFWAPTSM